MPRQVTLEQVNAFVWRKQHLAPGTAGSDVQCIVRDVVALHATSAVTPYLSLRARMTAFQPAQLDIELQLEHRLVKVLCMRQTVHVVEITDLHMIMAATGERLHANARRELRQLLRWSGARGPTEEQAALDRLQAAVVEVITTRGPSTAAELSEAIPELRRRFHYAPGKPYGGMATLGSVLLPRLTLLGLLVRGRPRGSWRSNQYEYALLRDWLPRGELPSIPPDHAQAQLVKRYLAAFGPATLEDATWWAGWNKGEARRALLALDNAVIQLDIQGLGAGFWLLASDMPTLLSTRPQDPGTVQLLPSLDGYIMGYHDRRRFLDPDHYDQVFDPSGNAFASVWLNGRVAGIWHETDQGLELLLWEDFAAEEVAAEAARLGSFLLQADTGQASNSEEVVVRRYPADLRVRTPFSLGRR